MDGTGFAVVNAPPLQPPRVGLLAAVRGTPYDIVGDTEQVPGLDEPQRWTLGFSYLPRNGCGTGGGAGNPCARAPKPLGPQQPWVEFEPFYVYEGDRCSAFGWEQHDYDQWAADLLAATESKRIASELWRGDIAQANPAWPNMWLNSPEADTLSGGPLSPAQALQCLEQGLGQCGTGQQGMLHVTRELAMAWGELGSTLRNANGQVLTYNDTIIVADAGYDGSGPNGAPATSGHQWAYGTSMVTVRRSNVTTVPGNLAAALDAARGRQLAAGMNRDTNLIEFRAERLAAATWDHGCCHLAVEVDLPLCLVGGAS